MQNKCTPFGHTAPSLHRNFVVKQSMENCGKTSRRFCNQLSEDKMMDQITMKEYNDPLGTMPVMSLLGSMQTTSLLVVLIDYINITSGWVLPLQKQKVTEAQQSRSASGSALPVERNTSPRSDPRACVLPRAGRSGGGSGGAFTRKDLRKRRR